MDKIEYSKKDEKIFEKLQNQGPLGKRALFIFQYLFLRKEFKKLVGEIRKELNIPENGFDPSSKEDMGIFLNKYVSEYDFNGEIIFQRKVNFDREINTKIENFVEQCGVLSYSPNMYLADSFIQSLIKEYILFNDFIGLYKGNFALTSIARYEDNTNGTEDQMEPIELRLEIPISVKKEEFKDYIDATWEAIEFAKKKVLKKNDFIRFRPRMNFIRDLEIYNKYLELEKLSKKQRKDKEIDYLEIGVKRELEEKGSKNIPDLGTIRSIVSRLKNEIKDKNAFWKEYEEEPISDIPLNKTDLDEF